MKSYTDLEQSKKLVEILPIESADQTWERVAIAGANLHVPEEMQYKHSGDVPFIQSNKIGVPCWSLAALLELIRGKVEYDLSVWDEGYNIDVCDLGSEGSGKVMAELYSNPVDAVVKTIYNLKERNLI